MRPLIGGLLFISCGLAMELSGVEDNLAYALIGALTTMLATAGGDQ